MRRRAPLAAIALIALTAALPAPASASVALNSATPDAETLLVTTSERLLAADTDTLTDAYAVAGGFITLVSAPGDGAAGPASDAFPVQVSADGGTFIFVTGQRMVGADTDSVSDVYQHAAGETTLVSAPGAGASGSPASAGFKRISADGSTVFFDTIESLVAEDTDTVNDIYKRSAGTTTLVSVPGAGSSGSPASALLTGISSDGSRAFFQTSENMIGADTDGLLDVYERSGVTTSLVTAPGVGASGPPALASLSQVSSDGTRAYFTTDENLVASDTDGLRDAYVRSGGTTTLISEPGVGASGPAGNVNFTGASDDGSKLFFDTGESLVTADTDATFDVYERSAGTTTLVSAPGVGASGPPDGINHIGNSGDGSIVFLETDENLVTADTDGFTDTYKRSAGSTTLVSVEGLGASGPFNDATFNFASDDGSKVFFDTEQNMLAADTDGLRDTYEASGGGVSLASLPGTGAAGPSEASTWRATSSDGSRLVFSTKQRLTGADLDADFDLYQRFGGVTTLLTAEPGPPLGGPPDTTITGTAPPFNLSSNEAGSSFQCSLDSGPFAACTSPHSPAGLPAGSHTLAVRATDLSGNVDPTPASVAFTADPPAAPAQPSQPAPAPKKCKKGQKLKKGKCVKKKRKKK